MSSSESMLFSTLFNALTEFNVSMKFQSWQELPEDQRLLFKNLITGTFIKEPEHQMTMAGFSPLFEQDCLCYVIVNESLFFEFEIRLPGIVNWITNQKLRESKITEPIYQVFQANTCV